jgi:hypothetical protein
MDKYKSYLWQEVPSHNYWRIQTTDPVIINKLKKRQTAELVGECFNHPMVIYRLQYYSPQKAKKSFERLTNQKIKKSSEKGIFFAETYPILTKTNLDEVS